MLEPMKENLTGVIFQDVRVVIFIILIIYDTKKYTMKGRLKCTSVLFRIAEKHMNLLLIWQGTCILITKKNSRVIIRDVQENIHVLRMSKDIKKLMMVYSLTSAIYPDVTKHLIGRLT